MKHKNSSFVSREDYITWKEKFLIKIRGKDEGTIGSIRLSKQETQDLPASNNAPTKAIITFDNAVFAPMRGQDVVAYANDDTIVLGGVII